MLFQRRTEAVDIKHRVESLQVEALQATMPGAAAPLLNQAGDLLLRSGDMVSALDLYGRAVDSLVEADRFEAAMALCNKIIRTVPEVVRARCTLTWLAIGAGFTGDLGERVGEYVRSAETAGRERVALQQLRQMGKVVDAEEARLALAESLLYLGDDLGANELFGNVYGDRNFGVLRTPDPDQRWRHARQGALGSRR